MAYNPFNGSSMRRGRTRAESQPDRSYGGPVVGEQRQSGGFGSDGSRVSHQSSPSSKTGLDSFFDRFTYNSENADLYAGRMGASGNMASPKPKESDQINYGEENAYTYAARMGQDSDMWGHAFPSLGSPSGSAGQTEDSDDDRYQAPTQTTGSENQLADTILGFLNSLNPFAPSVAHAAESQAERFYTPLEDPEPQSDFEMRLMTAHQPGNPDRSSAEPETAAEPEQAAETDWKLQVDPDPGFWNPESTYMPEPESEPSGTVESEPSDTVESEPENQLDGFTDPQRWAWREIPSNRYLATWDSWEGSQAYGGNYYEFAVNGSKEDWWGFVSSSPLLNRAYAAQWPGLDSDGDGVVSEEEWGSFYDQCKSRDMYSDESYSQLYGDYRGENRYDYDAYTRILNDSFASNPLYGAEEFAQMYSQGTAAVPHLALYGNYAGSDADYLVNLLQSVQYGDSAGYTLADAIADGDEDAARAATYLVTASQLPNQSFTGMTDREYLDMLNAVWAVYGMYDQFDYQRSGGVPDGYSLVDRPGDGGYLGHDELFSAMIDGSIAGLNPYLVPGQPSGSPDFYSRNRG